MKASANNRPQKLRRSSSGFTLIELMVTIAVLAIIVGIAAPNISTQLANQRVKSTASTLENALKEAKAESIIRRQNVTVAYSSVLNTIAITGRNNTVIATYNINSQSTVSQVITPATVTQVVFQPNKMVSGAGTEVVYTICDDGSTNETPKQVTVNKIANISVTNTGSC
ncbi:Tfp pilus assembly protein FimT/FimU [Psychrobacter sp. LFX-11D]|uniref:pilus assembly FimT family protein n=1 Tax=Psychrobacter sp. LFX-11D TaxID=458201 RepID=UPI00191873C0|nr:GspH/FimT family pseudopilin [Psychrobacter sp. LFX-11D]